MDEHGRQQRGVLEWLHPRRGQSPSPQHHYSIVDMDSQGGLEEDDDERDDLAKSAGARRRRTQRSSEANDEPPEEEIDLCDFCGIERAVELCRGSECRQLLNTNFPLFCGSCSQTLHRRYPHHRRFVDAGPAPTPFNGSRPSGRSSTPREIRTITSNHVNRHHPYRTHQPERDDRQRPLKSFARTGISPQSSKAVGIGPAQAQRLMMAHAQQVAAAHARSLETQENGKEWSSVSSPASLSPSDNTCEVEVCVPGDASMYSSPLRSVKKSVRSNQLEPVHERYDRLLRYLQANPGHSLQEAYKMTGIARSTVLGTRAIAELKIVDGDLFVETIERVGGKVKVAILNKACYEVLARPELELVVANMRLRLELLPFSAYQSKQLQPLKHEPTEQTQDPEDSP